MRSWVENKLASSKTRGKNRQNFGIWEKYHIFFFKIIHNFCPRHSPSPRSGRLEMKSDRQLARKNIRKNLHSFAIDN